MPQPHLMNPAQRRSERLALLTALVLILIWGMNFTLQKRVYNAVTPGGFLFVRYLIMPVCAFSLLLWRFGPRPPRVPRKDFWALVRLGIAGHFLHVTIVTFGIHWSTAFSSAVILACGPIFTLLILWLMGVEQLHRAQVIGVGIAFAGVLVFMSDKFLAGQWTASGGDLTVLLAAALFSYYTVAAKPMVERHGSVVTMAYATLLGSLPVLLVTLPAGLSAPWQNATLAIWASLLWTVTVSSFAGWLAWAWINAVRGVARTAPLMYLLPPVAGVIAWLYAGEHFTPIKVVGAMVALGGVALAQLSGNTAARLPPTPVD